MFNNYTLVVVSRSGIAVARGYEKVTNKFTDETLECLVGASHLLVLKNDKVMYEFIRGKNSIPTKSKPIWREMMNEFLKSEPIRALNEKEEKGILQIRYKVL